MTSHNLIEKVLNYEVYLNITWPLRHCIYTYTNMFMYLLTVLSSFKLKMPLLEHKLLTIPKHIEFTNIFERSSCFSKIFFSVLWADFCHFMIPFWPWSCLFLLKFIIVPLVSSNVLYIGKDLHKEVLCWLQYISFIIQPITTRWHWKSLNSIQIWSGTLV